MGKIFNYFVLMIVMALLVLIACGCSKNVEGGKTDCVETSTVEDEKTKDSLPSSGHQSSGKEDPHAVRTDERDYEIMYNYELDKCYFVFYDSTPYEEGTGGMYSASLEFSSIDDFLNRVLNGKLKSYEKGQLAVAFSKSEIGYEICDLKNMYYPLLPEGFEVDGFDWYGKNYTFNINDAEGDTNGIVSVYDEEAFSNIYERDYVNKNPPKGGNVVSKTIDGTNIIGRYFYSRNGELSAIQYELKDGEKTVYVEKRYYGEATLRYVDCYCVDGDKYYKFELTDLAQNPENDWLLSFSIEPYLQ